MELKIENLKEEVMAEIARCIEQKSDNRNYEVEKLLDKIKYEIISIMQESRIRVNEEYINSQLDVLKYGIKNLNAEKDQKLFSAIFKNLDRYVETLEKENDDNEKIKQQTVRYEIEENKEEREKDISYTIIPNIESYIHDAFSNTLKRMDNLGIRINESTKDELKYKIFSMLKNAKVDEIRTLFKIENNKMFNEIENKIDEFFSRTEQKEEEKEDNDKKPWELTPEELAEINPDVAIKEATEKAAKEELQALPDNILE